MSKFEIAICIPPDPASANFCPFQVLTAELYKKRYRMIIKRASQVSSVDKKKQIEIPAGKFQFQLKQRNHIEYDSNNETKKNIWKNINFCSRRHIGQFAFLHISNRKQIVFGRNQGSLMKKYPLKPKRFPFIIFGSTFTKMMIAGGQRFRFNNMKIP